MQVCKGKANATHMECRAPVLPEDRLLSEEKFGQIFFDLDGAKRLWNKHFDYHPNAAPIPFENEEHILYLKPGETEVSLHVGSHTLTLDMSLPQKSSIHNLTMILTDLTIIPIYYLRRRR